MVRENGLGFLRNTSEVDAERTGKVLGGVESEEERSKNES